MTSPDLVNAPIVTGVGNFPATIIVGSAVLMTALLLVVAHKFDATGGVLTISILITVGMLGAIAYCLIFTIPQDDITPGVVGGLTTGFGAVVAYWLGQAKERLHAPPRDEPPHEHD